MPTRIDCASRAAVAPRVPGASASARKRASSKPPSTHRTSPRSRTGITSHRWSSSGSSSGGRTARSVAFATWSPGESKRTRAVATASPRGGTVIAGAASGRPSTWNSTVAEVARDPKFRRTASSRPSPPACKSWRATGPSTTAADRSATMARFTRSDVVRGPTSRTSNTAASASSCQDRRQSPVA